MDTLEYIRKFTMYSAMDKTFSEWLVEQLKDRNWSNAELARRAGVTRGSIGNVIRGERQPGHELANAIAHALNLPPETVYRAAGLLPPLPTIRQAVDEILDYKLAELTPEQREEVLQYIDWLQQRDRRTIEANQTTRQGERPGEVVK